MFSILRSVTIIASTMSILANVMADRMLTHRVPIFGSFVGLEISHNPGIAFGLRLPPVVQEILIGVALIIVAIIAVHSARQKANVPFSIFHFPSAFGLILGGGIANIIDRVPDGLVTDFIQIGTFPTFNVADSCITVGAVLLLWESCRHGRHMQRKQDTRYT